MNIDVNLSFQFLVMTFAFVVVMITCLFIFQLDVCFLLL